MASQCAVRKVEVEGVHAAKMTRNRSRLLSAGYEKPGAFAETEPT